MRGIVKKSAIWELQLVRKLCVAAVAMLASSQASTDDDLMRAARQIFKPIPSIMPAVKDNPVTHEKVELGKMLFFDPRLSASQIISCNSCHNLGTGGVDAGPTSVGHGWQQGPRRAPTVYNAVYNLAQFWDGRAADLKAQAKGPVQARIEMNATPDHVLNTLNSMSDYVVMFKKAFPNEASPVTFDNFAKAIEAFEATLITPAAPFDQYLEGDTTALNDQQKAGLKLFMETGCSSCHNGINVGGQGYFPFGVIERPGATLLPASDKGRYAVTEAASDEYVFRAAPLRNVALRAPYFHSGQVWSLKQAVGVMGETQLGIELSDKEKNDIVAFLNALTGQLPKIEYPKLPTRTDATPPPSLGR
ncbi:cytochrome C peroxidase [Bradyrhizobium icense]|uniref:Cytochrome C peroxidase n=2 Tax=Bradyrhizobium icense TaxID=1274631 RepID=A0A1B1UJI8_9BRAD|nr:cytochrome C peroxidase [Bradyrhizobium icense]